MNCDRNVDCVAQDGMTSTDNFQIFASHTEKHNAFTCCEDSNFQ